MAGNYKLEDLQYRFNKYDKDGSGVISADEFREMYNSFSPVPVHKAVIDNLLKKWDKDGSNTITFDEFAQMMNQHPSK